VNGERRELPEGMTVGELVEDGGLATDRRRGIAVAIDAEVLPRSAWDETELYDGQRVEVLTAMQGG
jgi:sulfur carrier protein